METVRNIASAVIVIGGLGAFIDFLIGRTGQERAKDFLLRWWVRFDNVQWRTFGKEEGLFAGELIAKWLGRRVYSLRRFVAFFVLLIITSLWLYIIVFEINYAMCAYCDAPTIYAATAIITSFVGFSASISFTKFLTLRAAYLCGVGIVRNFVMFVAMMIINYLFLTYWSGMTTAIREGVLLVSMTIQQHPEQSTDQQIVQFIKETVSMDHMALYYLPTLPSLFRFGLSIAFVGSFLLRPLVMRPLNFIWRRIIEESEKKPVFTLIFGGLAAFASAISEAAKHI
jgi:hypothetical protein